MMFSFFNTLFLCALFVDLLERRFPEQVMNVVTDVTFNVLYIFSKTQIYFIKLNKTINKFLKQNSVVKNDLTTNTEFIKNGEKLYIENNEKHDFALFSWVEDESGCVNKKIVYDVTDVNDFITISEKSDIKFMLVELTLECNKTFKIDLKTRDYNFYLVGNKFTKDFFIYYLINYLNIDKTILNNTPFSIKIIDHNVNIFQMDFTDKNEHIILNKIDYLPVIHK